MPDGRHRLVATGRFALERARPVRVVLPAGRSGAHEEEAHALPDDVVALTARATGSVASVPPPWSAAHPYVGLYSPATPAIATVVGNRRLTAEDCDSDIRHIVLNSVARPFPC